MGHDPDAGDPSGDAERRNRPQPRGGRRRHRRRPLRRSRRGGRRSAPGRAHPRARPHRHQGRQGGEGRMTDETGAPRRPAGFVPAAGAGLRKALAAALGAKHGAAAWFALSALRRGGGPGDAVRAYRAQLAWERGDSARAEADWRSLAERAPSNPDWPLWLSNAARTRGEFATAERILVEARDRGAAGPALEMTIEHYGRWLRRSNIAPAEAEALVNDPGAPPYRLLHASIFLSTEGRLDPAPRGPAAGGGPPPPHLPADRGPARPGRGGPGGGRGPPPPRPAGPHRACRARRDRAQRAPGLTPGNAVAGAAARAGAPASLRYARHRLHAPGG